MPILLANGKTQRVSLPLPEPPRNRDRDELHVSIKHGRDVVVWRQDDPGDARARASAMAPVWSDLHQASLRRADLGPRPKTATFSSLSYQEGWNPALRDVVVSLPSGARFVFWRGSSYIPFWAGRYNTGACYEWAEMISGRRTRSIASSP